MRIVFGREVGSGGVWIYLKCTDTTEIYGGGIVGRVACVTETGFLGANRPPIPPPRALLFMRGLFGLEVASAGV